MKRILWALLMVSVAFSAWGLFLDKAFASEQAAPPADQQILPPQDGFGNNRALGVAARPAPQKDEYQNLQTEESPAYEAPSYDSSNNSSDDD